MRPHASKIARRISPAGLSFTLSAAAIIRLFAPFLIVVGHGFADAVGVEQQQSPGISVIACSV